MYAAVSVAIACIGHDAVGFLYGFHLLDVVLRSALIQETLHALRAYTASLGATALLWVLLMYLFALVGHASFPQDFPEDECSSLPQCVAFTLNFGMRAGGGLGDVLAGGDGASKGLSRMVSCGVVPQGWSRASM